MNLLEHYIEKVYSAEDVSRHFLEQTGEQPKEPLIKASLRVNCYGVVEDTEKVFPQSEWEEAQEQGYYMA